VAISNTSVKRRLDQFRIQPTQSKPFEEEEKKYTIQPTASAGMFTTTAQPTAAPRTTATYAPGSGNGTPNYTPNQQYDNGVQASPTIGQKDLPKYENVDQFDFNRNYEDTLDQLQRQRADLQQQNDLATQRLQEDYQRRFREIRQQQQDAMRLDAERMASRGILRSGLAVKSAGDIGGEFGGALDEQQRALSAAIENQNAQFAQSDRGIQEQIGKAQEYLTRQQQMLEEQRARQAAAAAAAQRAAYDLGNVAEAKKPTMNVVKDNMGRYFVVDSSMNRQSIDPNQLGALGQTYNVNQIDSLAAAGQIFGNDYVKNANALARRLGGNLGGQASLDVRLGFRDAGKWGG